MIKVRIFPVRVEVLTALIIKITVLWDVTPCGLVEREHAQHWQYLLNHTVSQPRILSSQPCGEQRNFVEKHYLTLLRPIRKPTSVFIIYIHNVHYIILISLFP